MYIDYQQYDKAQRVAKAHLSGKERQELYISLAQKNEQGNKLAEAEQM